MMATLDAGSDEDAPDKRIEKENTRIGVEQSGCGRVIRYRLQSASQRCVPFAPRA